MYHPPNYGPSNSKFSYTEIEGVDFDDPVFSNPDLFSLSYSHRPATATAAIGFSQPHSAAAATAGDDCPEPQLQVPLPLQVQQKLNSICEEKEQPQPDSALRRRLGLLGEEKALELLGEIYNTKKKIKNLSGYIWFFLRQEKYQCAPRSRSPSPSPSKSGPAASPLPHSPSSASQITPGRQGSTSGGQMQLHSYFSASPSKSVRASLFQGQSSAPITPVRQEQPADRGGRVGPFYSSYPSNSHSKAARTSLFQGPSSASPTSKSSLTPVRLFQDQPRHDGQAQLEALGELEFRRQFLILNYSGGMKLEDVLAPETIRSWKDMPMQRFENTAWETLGRKYARKENRQWTLDWESGKAYVYHCEVAVDGSYNFKGPYLHTAKRTLLQKVLGDDSILVVKFADVKDPWKQRDLYADYSKVAREGILVGLRRYCFFVFKDGKEKKKSPTSSPVKCYFIRVDSSAAIDREEDYKISNKTIHEARCIFMHPHTVSTVSNYMIRFSLILSKTESLEVKDWSLVRVDDIDDEYCLDAYGNRIYRDGKPLIHSDGTGFISEDLASLCPKELLKKEEFSNEYFEPLLMQFRLFYKGRAVKGTFLVNKKLPPKTIQIRPSMIKVETDRQMLDGQTVNSLEIVGVSTKPRNTKFSRNLIALLCLGGVPKDYFMELLMKDLENTNGVFCNRRAAAKVAFSYGGMDDDYNTFKMISSDIPLEESYLRHRLSFLKKQENTSLQKGKISSPQSYMLMGTTDPTGILEKDQVCVLLDSGPIQGDVLVYRHPGLHLGDVHVLKATYVDKLKEFVGNSGFAIFFSRKGSRSVADEMGGGDFDGDLYWVSRNPRLLECFKQSEPWIDTSSTPKAANTIPPSALLPDHIEDALFKQFLTTRFEPSYAMSTASHNWLAYMDEYLTLGDGHEKTIMKAKMLRLIDLYYDALDAPKKCRTVEIPSDLEPRLFPHYMGKPNSYKSTSILGSIYDAVEEYQPEDTSDKVVEKLPCFDVEDLPEQCLKKWYELYELYRSEMTSVLQYDDKEGKNKAADKIIRRYKEILYGCEDFEKSTRPLDEIFNEALAIYRFAYDYAWKVNDVGKCGFAWKVAGSALCKYYKTKHEDRTFEVSFSVLKDIL